ncbi:MAG: HAD-IA family hydrolase [Eubacteriales bacterium]
MKDKKITTILFDFDGTLIDTNEIIIQSFQHTFRTVLGEEKPVDDIIRTFGEPLSLTMEKMLDIDPVEAVKIYRAYHNQKFEDLIRIFPGMLELVIELFNRGYKLAIVTSRLRNTTLLGLRKFDLEKYFSYVLTADDTDKHKPDPAAINLVLEKLNSKPDEAIMIGDSKFDIMCANNAGVKSILVGWAISLTDEEKEGIYKPTYIVENAEDVLDLLD